MGDILIRGKHELIGKTSMSDAPTVGNLVRWLSRLPQDALVVLASDVEGNKFSPLENLIGQGFYIPRIVDGVDTNTGSVADIDEAERYPELMDEWYGEDHIKVSAIILWPIQ